MKLNQRDFDRGETIRGEVMCKYLNIKGILMLVIVNYKKDKNKRFIETDDKYRQLFIGLKLLRTEDMIQLLGERKT